MKTDRLIEFTLPDAKGFMERNHSGMVMHVMPLQGLLTVTLEGTVWAVNPGEYLILPSGVIISDAAFSSSFQGFIFSFTPTVANKLRIRSRYGAIGHLSLMRRPVMSLSPDIVEIFKDDLSRLKARIENTTHLYYEESVLAQLSAHVLDLFDIHGSQNAHRNISERYAAIVEGFIKMLFDGEYIGHREVRHYAERLCISPKHLADVCVTVSGQPPLYWINRFMVQDLVCRLSDASLSLSQIAFDLNFSSLSHLSRYCSKHLGMPPSSFRLNK